MSKTASTKQTRIKAHTESKIPARPQTRTGRSSPTAFGVAKPGPVRKASPAAVTPAVPASRTQGPAIPAAGVAAVAAPMPRRPSKLASIEAMLRRPEGAAIVDLVTATGWQQHSVRAALTGLRKQGHSLSKEAGPTGCSIYRITQDQPAQA